MISTEKIVSELRNEADVDFVSIPMIAGTVEEDLALKDPEEVRRWTLAVARGLMTRGVYPGDYDNATKITFWPGTPDEHLKRIETEWVAMGKRPDFDKPICWFGLLRPEAT